MSWKNKFRILPKSLRTTLINAFALMTVIPLLVVFYYLFEYSFEELLKYQSTTIALLIVIFLSLLGFWIIYRVIQALIALAKQAESIQKTGSLQNIKYEEDNEIHSLVSSFNNMMGKLKDKILELEKVNEQLQILSITDELTGVYNFRSFKDFLMKEISRSNRKGYSITLLMIDIDNFKEMNDRYGHFTGNELLKNIANIIKSNVRRYDIVSRYGGDEFTVILPETNLMEGEVVATRLRSVFEKTKIKLPMGVEEPISVSIGMTTADCNDKKPVQEDLLVESADQALYRAKSKGGGGLEKFRMAS